MPLPSEYLFTSIACPGGEAVSQTIACMPRGTIAKLRVVQLSGNFDGFSYVVYNTQQALSTLASTEVLYRVTPLLTVTATNTQFVSTEGFPEDGIVNLHLPFVCLDNRDNPNAPLNVGQTQRDNKLYLKITAAGTGSKTFGVAMTILDPLT